VLRTVVVTIKQTHFKTHSERSELLSKFDRQIIPQPRSSCCETSVTDL